MSAGDLRSNTGAAPVDSDAGTDSESEEERLQLSHRLSPVNALDVSSLAEP